MTLLSDFFLFLKTFGIVGLAIAFIIGNASSSMVSSLVDDVINPTVGLFLPSGNLDNLNMTVPTLAGGGGNHVSTFKYGALISSVINFVIIAFLVFLAYRELKKFGKLGK